jgi:hypothetical protein
MLSKKGIASLRIYVQNGGFIMADACCADRAFDKGFRLLMKMVFPKRKLEKIPVDDPVYKYPFDLTVSKVSATKAYHQKYQNKWPELWGIRRAGANGWAVVYSPVDFCCALEGDLEDDICGLKLDSALPFIANILSAGFRGEEQ